MDFKKTYQEFKESLFPGNSEKQQIENAVKKITSQIKNQHSLFRKEIKEWKMYKAQALDSEMPRRANLILLYIDIMEDAFIFGRWNNRKFRISNKAIQVVSNGEINEDKTNLFKKLWFNRYLKHYMDSKAFGPTLIYPKNIDEDGYIKDIDIVPRTNVVPETCEILKNVYDQKGVRFDESPLKEWSLLLGDVDDLGLLNKAAPLWIFKKHSWQNWDEFEEMFGVPMRIAKVASSDKRVQNEVQKWLKSLGSAGYAMFQEGTDIEIVESKSKDAFNVFNEKRKAVNEEIAILFDGQFESSTESGSNAKAGVVIENTQKEITKDDATTALFSINEQLLPFLIKRGYPFDENDEVQWNDNKETTPEQRLKIFKGVKELGFSVVKKQIETELDVELDNATPPEPSKPPAPSNFNLPHNHLCGCGACSDTYRIINLEIINQLTNDEEELLRAIWKNKDTINWNYKEFMATHGKLLSSVRSGFGNVDFDFESVDHIVVEALQNNIHRFGTDKTQKQLYDLNKIIKDTDVDTFEKFFKRAQKVFPNYKRTWAKAEWNQAYATSQAASAYNNYMNNVDIAPFWRYISVMDGRQRPEHGILHNKVFRKSDTNAWQFLAPNGWECRCDNIELIDYDGEITSYEDAIALDPDGFEKMKKSGHAVNWGNQKEVFITTQSYLHSLSINSLNVSDFNFKTFDLKPFSTTFKTNLIGSGKINFNDFTDRSGDARFNTVEDLPVWLSEETFNNIDNEIKHQLKNVLNNPDEVFWSDSDDSKVKSYFKHFKDGSLEALIDVSKKATLYSFIKHKNPDAFRKGLLIYTPETKIQHQLALYNEFDNNYTKEFFNAKNGGFVVSHKKHGKTEKRDNLIIANKLAEKGKGIELIENFDNIKSFDANIDGVEWEFKTLTNFSNLKNAVDRELRNAVKQSSNILLFINNGYKNEDLITGVERRTLRNKEIKFIAILFKDGRLIKVSRKQIESGEFRKLVKK